MSNTFIEKTNNQYVDSNNILFEETDNQNTLTYTERNKGVITLASSASYTEVPLGGVSSASYIYVESPDADLNVKLNSSSDIIEDVSKIIFWGTFTKIEISQESGASVNVNYEVLG